MSTSSSTVEHSYATLKDSIDWYNKMGKRAWDVRGSLDEFIDDLITHYNFTKSVGNALSGTSVGDPLNPSPELVSTTYYLSGTNEYGMEIGWMCHNLNTAKGMAAEVLPRGGEVITQHATFSKTVVDTREEQAHDKLISACVYLRNQYGRNATEQARRILTDAARSIGNPIGDSQ